VELDDPKRCNSLVEVRPADERELVLRAQNGDERAFEQLVRAHGEIVFRVAYLITGQTGEAEDAAQEGLMKAWRAFGRFRSDSPLRPWLLTIVANEARNRRRSTTRRMQLALRVAQAEGQPSAGLSAEADAVAASERARLFEAVNGLPEAPRAVLTCRFLLGLSEEETAAALGLGRGTVKSRTARALDRLRESYD
jgi:RNA polymerase sigma factor (sigma-70 family)